MHAGAVAMAALIGEQMQADMVETWQAAKVGKLSPLVLKFDIETDLTKEQIDMFPIPDSYADAKDGPSGCIVSANNPAKFKFWNEKTKKDETGDYYEDLIASLPMGATNRKTYSALLDAKRDIPSTDQGRTFKELGDDAVDAVTVDIIAEFNNYKNNFMKAVRVILQERAFKEHLSTTIAHTIMTDEKTGEYLSTQKPIRIGENKPLGKSDIYTVTSFLSFDPEEAAKNGGTFDALKKTLEREAIIRDKFTVNNTETATVAFDELRNWLTKISEDEKEEKAFYKFLQKPGNAAFVKTMYDLNALLDDYTVKPDLRKIADAA
jgi:hypothetical protein